MSAIKFGTDGWRAVIAEDFTFANVARVAQATADFWKSEIRNPKSEIFGREPKVVIGYDRRFFSDRFAQITAEVFAGNDFQVVLTPEPTPTPSVSFAVKNLGAIGGVMITASHNPPIFNGFKLKSHYGGSSESGRHARPSKVFWTAIRSANVGDRNQQAAIINQRHSPRALCRDQKARGFQAHRQIEIALRA